MKRYDVGLLRGFRVTLPPHPLACDLSDLGGYARTLDTPLAVDLFCGAGGLSLGLERAGFSVILGVDSDAFSVETHRAHFGGATVQADLSSPDTINAIVTALRGIPVHLVAASPPCQPFSRAGRSKIRSLTSDASADTRRELWRSVVTIAGQVRPRAVLFENVPGMIQGEDLWIATQLVEALEALGYDTYARLLRARDYGVPQHRERVFVVAVEQGLRFEWPRPSRRKLTLRDAISDFPPVEGGVHAEYCAYAQPRTVFQRWARRGVSAADRFRIYDHLTRPVRKDDLEAFRLMDHRTRYTDLPPRLRRYRADIFEDKYKRLDWDDVSRTITAHIAKDGYWYVHPQQHRTLTVREAARIQAFPDWFRFAGTPSHMFRQIGNAVPPLLAAAIGRAILRSTVRTDRDHARVSCLQLSNTLASWISRVPEAEMIEPWRKSGNLWHTLLGMALFRRASRTVVQDFWAAYSRRWHGPQAFLADPLRQAALRAIGRGSAESQLLQIARALAENPSRYPYPGELTPKRLKLAGALCGIGHPPEPTSATARVAERVFGETAGDSKADGLLMLARMVGTRQTAPALAALLEIGDRYCRPAKPTCEPCPLSCLCATGRRHVNRNPAA
jgi:DNA (cytosine-5)-methyltransferase 1